MNRNSYLLLYILYQMVFYSSILSIYISAFCIFFCTDLNNICAIVFMSCCYYATYSRIKMIQFQTMKHNGKSSQFSRLLLFHCDTFLLFQNKFELWQIQKHEYFLTLFLFFSLLHHCYNFHPYCLRIYSPL